MSLIVELAYHLSIGLAAIGLLVAVNLIACWIWGSNKAAK